MTKIQVQGAVIYMAALLGAGLAVTFAVVGVWAASRLLAEAIRVLAR